MPPKRSVVPDTKLSQDARGEPLRVPLTGPSQLDDLARDKFCFVISRTDGKLKSGACNLERLAHGFNVLGSKVRVCGAGLGIVELPLCAVGRPTYTISLNRVGVICI